MHRDQVRELTTAEALTARPRLRRLTASILVLLIVMLPVLLAFVRIEAAPRDAEIARVEQAVLAEKSMQSKPILMFYGLMVSEDAPGRWEEHKKYPGTWILPLVRVWLRANAGAAPNYALGACFTKGKTPRT